MLVYQNILVPYDDSKFSDGALENAADLARLSKGTLHLLYVVPEIHLRPSLDYGMKLPGYKSSREYLKELYHDMKEKSLKMLEDKKEKLGKDISVQVHVSAGDPASQILDFAAKHHIDLIAMGRRGRGGFARLKTIGSVSRKVGEHAQCAVMIVH